MRALEALVAEGSGDDAALLAVSLSWYWRGRAGLGVAREWLSRAALIATDDERRLRVLIALSGVAFSQGDLDDARRSAEQAHEIALRLRRADLLAAALVQRAQTEALPAAENLHSEARALYEQLGDSYGLATQTINLGNVALIKADYSAAASLSEEGTVRAAELGNRDAIGVAFRNLAISRYFLGDLQSAQAACVHALGAAVAIDDRDAMSACLDIIAAIWARTDRVSDAAMLLEITGSQRASTGFILEIPEARVRADAEHALVCSPKAQGTDEVESVSLPTSLGEAVEYVLASID